MKSDKNKQEKGREPKTATTGEDALRTEDQFDNLESGQFAPSGYYNQQGVNARTEGVLMTISFHLPVCRIRLRRL